MIYVASLYSLNAKSNSFQDTCTRQHRYEYTEKRVSEFLSKGELVYSPIVHCHNMSVRYSLPKEYKFWQNIDRHMIDLCEGVYVLMMEDWELSEGITDEINYAMDLGKPVTYISCNDFMDVYNVDN